MPEKHADIKWRSEAKGFPEVTGFKRTGIRGGRKSHKGFSKMENKATFQDTSNLKKEQWKELKSSQI